MLPEQRGELSTNSREEKIAAIILILSLIARLKVIKMLSFWQILFKNRVLSSRVLIIHKLFFQKNLWMIEKKD